MATILPSLMDNSSNSSFPAPRSYSHNPLRLIYILFSCAMNYFPQSEVLIVSSEHSKYVTSIHLHSETLIKNTQRESNRGPNDLNILSVRISLVFSIEFHQCICHFIKSLK